MRRTDQLDSQILFDYTWNKKRNEIFDLAESLSLLIWYDKNISNKTYLLLPVILIILNNKENLIIVMIFDWNIVGFVQIDIVYIYEFNYVYPQPDL